MKLFRIIVALCGLAGLVAPLQAQTCNASIYTESTPAAEFTDAGDGTVTHLRTGLNWKRCAEGQTWNGSTCTGTASELNWQNALFAARAASFAGRTDWRLPNVKELESIVEGKCYNASINSHIFPNTPASSFWSASATAYSPSNAWGVSFGNGFPLEDAKYRSQQVRLVRAGRSFGSFDALDTSSRLFLQATSLSFAVQNIGSTSAAQNVTLSNTGNQPLTIGTIAASSGYTVTHNCGSSLAAVASCTLSIRFAPAASGTLTGSVITSDSVGSPHTVNLSGSGVVSAGVALSPGSLAFATQLQGSPSAAKSIILLNSGTAVLSSISITTSGDFTQTNTCGTSQAAGASCTIYVVFTPIAAGNGMGSLSVSSNAPGSPHAVGLSGTGLSVNAPACTLSAAPPSIRKNATARLSASCSPVATSYNWTGGTCVSTHTATCDVTPAASTSYTVSGTNNFGASPIATATVTVRSADLTPILMLLLD